MKFLFEPGIALMNRLRYPWKFALVGAISLVVIGSLFGFFVSSLREDINFVHTERAALEAVPQMLKLIKLTQQHRGLAAGALNGNQEMRDKLGAKTAEVDAAAQALDGALADPELARGMAQRLSSVKEEWARLRASGMSMSPRDNLAAHTRLVAQEVIALHDVGDVGLLALDPSADTYYLIDNVLRRVPNVSERLGRLRAIGSATLATRSVDDEQRYLISRQLGELELSVQDLNENFDRAIKANPALRDELDALRSDFNESAGKVVGELQDHVLKSDFNMEPQAYFALVSHAIDVVYDK
ncbi:MAG: hypothetical protein HGA47_13510, partial [Zoogloea sp.]|nr:hypothetical protein [Zoogloea sp.]